MLWAVLLGIAAQLLWDAGASDVAWTFVGGSRATNEGAARFFGQLGEFSSSARPGAVFAHNVVFDSNDDLWVFFGALRVGGGHVYTNAVWKYSAKSASPQWMWAAGSTAHDASVVFGTPADAFSPGATPGARQGSVVVFDGAFFWAFGGRVRHLPNAGSTNDLWVFNPTNRQWAYKGGTTVVYAYIENAYGSKGVAESGNWPGCRYHPGMLATADGLWLGFGEFYHNPGSLNGFNDLSFYDFSTGHWTWHTGAKGRNQRGVYGTINQESSSNTPGARYRFGFVLDKHNDIWLFGGFGWDGSSSNPAGALNDLWIFSIARKAWTWKGGSTLRNQTPIYGQKNTAHTLNIPGARHSMGMIIDPEGTLYMGFGQGYDTTAAYDYLNDLWSWDASRGWIWLSGSTLAGEAAFCQFGNDGVPSASNVPCPRWLPGVAVDSANNFFMFGGRYSTGPDTVRGDLWRLNAYLRCPTNHYKASPAEDACTPCPVPSMSPSASAGIGACYCPVGYVGSAGACTACSAGKYNAYTKQSSCTNCPAGTYGSSMALTSASCTGACPIGNYCPVASVSPTPCPAGRYGAYAGLTSSACTGTCAANHYCPAGSRSAQEHQCPWGTVSPAASTSEAACRCPAGKGKPAADQNCAPCPAGTFSTGDALECSLCPAGRYGGLPGTTNPSCSGQCQAGHYCPAGSTSATQNACPANSTSPTGSIARADCLCLPGYSGTETCSACTPGTYKSTIGSAPCSPCPADKTSPFAASSEAQCVCKPGYDDIAGACVDRDECLEDTMLCLEPALCENLPGSYRCLPKLLGEPIAIVAGATLNEDGHPVLVNTLGGQLLRFSVYLGSAVDSIVSYGPVTDATRFTCSDVVYTPFGRSFNVTCSTSPGYGRDLAFHVQACMADNCYSLRADDQLFHYPAPSITNGTLRVLGGTATTDLSMPTSQSVVVEFGGANFSPFANALTVSYGPEARPNTFACAVRPETTDATIRCQTQDYSSGAGFIFTVRIGGYTVSGTDTISFPLDIPFVYGVSGCGFDRNNQTRNCPTAGDIYITLTGAQFLPPLAAFVSGKPCAPIREANASRLECKLPPGTGGDQSVAVSANGKYSPLALLLSYAAPSVTRLSGCNVTISSNHTGGCNRKGGEILTLHGENFGTSGAAIFVGSDPCSPVTHEKDTKLMCPLPANARLDRTVMVVQHNGFVSGPGALVSYSQCQPGEWERGVECFPCAEGKYTSTQAQTNCATCERGFYAAAAGQSACVPCSPGTISDRGESSCRPCEPGSYQSAAGQSACLVCPSGRYTERTGATQCDACDIGYFQALTNSTSCDPCIPGTYSAATGQLECQPCADGKAANATGASTCASCAPGTFAARNGSRGASACEPCQLGHYAPQAESTACRACRAGEYADRVGLSSCRFCDPGRFSSQDRASVCARCDPGMFSPVGQSGCSSCAPGLFITDNSTACELCPRGSVSRGGSTSCQRCQPGRYAAVSTCFICQPGSFASLPGATSCELCPPGSYNSSSESTICHHCQPGTFSRLGATQCEPCPVGRWSAANATGKIADAAA